jgi:solute carrier family 25 carnitine/acylcarnitine transporter 20/29
VRSLFVSILREEGFRNGLYKGATAAVAASAAEHAMMFWAYRNATAWFEATVFGAKSCPWLPPKDQEKYLSVKDQEKYLSVAFGAAVCGTAASFALTPFEHVKCNMQVQNTLPPPLRKFTGVVDCAAATVRLGGLQALYRGNVAMLVREVPGCCAYFLTFQAVARHLLSETEASVADASVWKHLVAGGLAGVAFWTVTYPADVVKTRIQTRELDATAGRSSGGSSVRREIASLYRSAGFRGLYRGWSVTAMRAFPANAVLLAVYLQVESCWDHLFSTQLLTVHRDEQ